MTPFQFFLVPALFIISLACARPATSEAVPDHSNISDSLYLHLPNTGFFCAYVDDQDNLWLGSRGSGVYKFDGQTFTNYTEANGLANNEITSISKDHKGKMWFGTRGGACWFNGTEFGFLEIPYSDTSSLWLDQVYPVIDPNEVMSIHADRQGNLWFGTNGAGVYRYNGTIFEQFLSDVGMVYDDGMQRNIILTMTEDPQGHIWFSSLSHAGVSRYDGKEFIHYVEELSDDFVRVVYSDHEGKIWIGAHGNLAGGFDLFDGEQFTTYYKTDQGLQHNNVVSVCEDNEGLLWLGSGTSPLTTFDGEHFEVVRDAQGNSFDLRLFAVRDQRGFIWFGGPHGLWRFNGEEVFEITRR